MWRYRCDPGPCIICGAPHTTCTGLSPEGVPGDTTPAAAADAAATVTAAPDAPGTFTTATYRRDRDGARPSR